MADVGVGGAAEDIDTVEEEADPAREKDKKEGEFAAAREVVQVLAA